MTSHDSGEVLVLVDFEPRPGLAALLEAPGLSVVQVHPPAALTAGLVRSLRPRLVVLNLAPGSEAPPRPAPADVPVLWLHHGAAPVREGDGAVVKPATDSEVLAAVRDALDAAALAPARPAVSVSRAGLEAVFDAAPDAMLATDAQGRIVLASQAVVDLFGYSREELAVMTVEALIPAAAASGHRAAREAFVTRRGRRPMGQGRALFGRRRDGTQLPVDICLSVADLGEGPIAIAAIRDISERRRMETALRESESRLQTLFEQAVVGVAELDVDTGRVLRSNSRFAALLGVEGRPGTDFVEAFSRDAQPRLRAALGAVRGGRSESHCADYVPAGKSCEVNLTLSAVRERGDRVTRAMVVLQDVSWRRDAEAELLRARDELHHARQIEALGRLAAGVAHDFNNLLTIILGTADLLDRELATSSARHFVEDLRSTARRAADLTGQLLAFARKQTVTPRLLRLDEALSGATRLLRRVLGASVELHLSLPADLWAVRADPAQLDQVLVNLAVNARDAMPGGGRLAIVGRNAAGRAGDEVQLVVSDTGSGMAPDVLEHAFEPFFTTKEPGAGTGLGLATVRSVVEQLGGHVEAESAAGLGTTFTVSLPRAVAPTPGPAEVSVPAPASQRGQSVLVAEEDAPTRKLAVTTLQQAGYRAIGANSGAAARRVASELPALHLALVDLALPDTSGPALARRLKDDWTNLRVLYVRGASDEAVAGSRPALEKPFEAEALLRAVHAALAS